MSEYDKLARPYAKAALAIAKNTGKLAQWSTMLDALSIAMSSHKLVEIIDDPKLLAPDRVKLLESLCKEWVFLEGLNFIKLLVRNKRLALLLSISKQFEVLKAQEEKIVNISVKTAFPLDKHEQLLLVDQLKDKVKQRVEVLYTVQSELIGGVLIYIEDKVIDASILGNLNKLQDALRA